MTRRLFFLTLACSVLMLSACGFQLRGQQDYAFKRLFVAGGSASANARLARMVQGGSDTVVVNSVTSGEGVVLRFAGRGKVLICSRNREAFVAWMMSHQGR